jgi:general secretion pathway protein D
LVEDGSIVVLGGLLQDKYSGGQEKVPGLGDIPLFGSLFKSEARSRNKTNLMVFLRPIVIRDAASSEALALDRYDMIRATQEGNQPDANIMLRAVPQSPVVPTLTRAVGTSVPSGGKP